MKTSDIKTVLRRLWHEADIEDSETRVALGEAMKAVSAEGLKFEEIKDNITISNSEDEVVAVIAHSEIILKKGYKVCLLYTSPSPRD